MIIKLKELKVIPALMALVFAMYNSLTFTALEMQSASYLSLAIMLLTGCATALLIVHQRGLSRFAFCVLVMLLWIAAVTMLNGNDLKNWIYQSVSLTALLFMFDYYREDIRPLIIGLLIGFTVSIFASLAHMVMNPHLWVTIGDEDKNVTGFLLGGNYNQTGPRLLCALVANILCLKYSKWFWVNLVPLAVVSLSILFMVQSMTALVGLLMFLIFCMLPNLRFSRLCITGLLCFVIFFQIFVCFNGKGIENNEYATWFIVDVLGKDITFTERTTLWDAAMRLFVESPLMGYGLPTTEWYYSNLASFAIGPHNLILGLMLFGGIPAALAYIALTTHSIIGVLRIKDKYATALYAAFGVWSLMSLMEIYSTPIIFYFIILIYYYGRGKTLEASDNSDEQQNENHSQHPCSECA